jgi:hypothetical protein
VASHARSFVPCTATTLHQHRPKSHQAHLEWTPSRLINGPPPPSLTPRSGTPACRPPPSSLHPAIPTARPHASPGPPLIHLAALVALRRDPSTASGLVDGMAGAGSKRKVVMFTFAKRRGEALRFLITPI